MQKKQLEFIEEKVIPSDKIEKQSNLWRFLGNRIVFTNGCFDILHRGHIEYLAAAADLGSKLIIGLKSCLNIHEVYQFSIISLIKILNLFKNPPKNSQSYLKSKYPHPKIFIIFFYHNR